MCGSRPEERWMEHEGTYQWRAFFVDVSSITLRGAVIEGVCVQKHVKPPTNCVICGLFSISGISDERNVSLLLNQDEYLRLGIV